MNNYYACSETTPLKWLGKLAIEDLARPLCNLNYPSQNYLTNKKKLPHRIMKNFQLFLAPYKSAQGSFVSQCRPTLVS